MPPSAWLFYAFAAVSVAAALWYNARYRKRLEKRLFEWARENQWEIVSHHHARVWRGLGQKYQRGDGVYDVEVRRGAGLLETRRVVVKRRLGGSWEVSVDTRFDGKRK